MAKSTAIMAKAMTKATTMQARAETMAFLRSLFLIRLQETQRSLLIDLERRGDGGNFSTGCFIWSLNTVNINLEVPIHTKAQFLFQCQQEVVRNQMDLPVVSAAILLPPAIALKDVELK